MNILRIRTNPSKLAILAILLMPFARAAKVQLVIQGEDGKLIRNTPVLVVGNLRDKANHDPVYAVTDVDGRAMMDVPEAGEYSICVSDPERELLDSCLWPNATATLSIAANTRLAGASVLQKTVVLLKGTTVKIRVLDPDDQIPTPKDTDIPSFLRAGVWSSAHFYHATMVAYDKNSIDYEVVVPRGADVNIAFEAAGVTVKDNNGRDAKPGVDSVSFRTKTNEGASVHIFRAISTDTKAANPNK